MASLARAHATENRAIEIWSLLTEHAWFSLVEGAGAIELFRATSYSPPTVAAATRRFLELHPIGAALPQATPRPPTPRPTKAPAPYDCRTCRTQVTPHRPSGQAERRLCERCYHVERQRERYRDDPEVRARRLASKAAHYRRSREAGDP